VGVKGYHQQYVPVVNEEGTPHTIPMQHLGEGVNRLFGIAIALVSAKNGFLLIDEIESGLHYSALLDLWRLIFDMAGRLNVQVFATTHSGDCLTAFTTAAQEEHASEGQIIRLGRDKHDDIVATLFDKADMAILNREEIEVR